jgi:transaldolase
LEFERLFKKLSNIKGSITTKKVENFFFKRIPQDKALKGVDIVTIALTLMYLHKHFVEKKDFTFTENVEEILQALREQSKNDKELFNDSLLFGVDLFKSIYPDKAGLLEFKKILGKEPFNYLIK